MPGMAIGIVTVRGPTPVQISIVTPPPLKTGMKPAGTTSFISNAAATIQAASSRCRRK